MDVDHFRSLLVENACERAEEKLLASWFPRVTSMFSGPHCKAPSPFQAKNCRFYKCVDTLMSNQLCSLLTSTILSYMDIYQDEGSRSLPQFKLHLCLDGRNIEFFPSLGELEMTVLCPVEITAAAMSDVSCVKVCWYHPSLRHMEGRRGGGDIWEEDREEGEDGDNENGGGKEEEKGEEASVYSRRL